jgi:hypothetical protein
MTDQYIPTLSDIVDMIQMRLDHVAEDGNPDEATALIRSRDVIAAFAEREQRLARLIQQATPKDEVA